jgi:MFS transporter, DHA1 family, tetracycline resistance protein
MNEPATAPKSNRSAMMIVFLVVVVDLLGFGIVLPLLPLTGKEYLEPIFPGEPGLVGLFTGLLLSIFSFMQFLLTPSWGRLSDRIGRRPVLLVGLVGSVVFYALFGVAAGLPVPESATLALVLMFVARAGAGVSGATIATAQAVIADCTPPEKRKHGMALIGAAFGIAFTVGPLLGAAAMYYAPDNRTATSWTGYIAAALSLVALLLAVARLRETRTLAGAPPMARKLFDLNAWRSVLANPALAPVVLTFFLATLGFGAFESTLALLIQYVLNMRPEDAKDKLYLVFAYVGFVLMLTQGVLYRRLAKRVSEATFMTMGLVLMALGVVSLGGISYLRSLDTLSFDGLVGLLMVALSIAVVGFAFLTPSAQALISRRTSADRQGEVLGVNQSASALARILGPVLGNSLFAVTQTHMLPYLFGAGLLLLMLPLIPRIRRG